jgi:hypothetical protein
LRSREPAPLVQISASLPLPADVDFHSHDIPQDSLDNSMFAQPYDAFRYSLMSTSQGDISASGMNMLSGSVDSALGSDGMGADLLQDAGGKNQNSSIRDARRSSSEEKDLTPAQSRRKAQNRAA